MGLGLTLKYLRLKAGLKQREVARQVGTSAAHLSLIESGKRTASIDILSRVADALAVPVELLLIEAKEQSGELSPRQLELFDQAKRLLVLAWRIERGADAEGPPGEVKLPDSDST